MMQELLNYRTESSRTFLQDPPQAGRLALQSASGGAIHYKENYADPSEPWKAIAPVFVNTSDILSVSKAPYELSVDTAARSIQVRSRKDGAELFLRLDRVKNALGDVVAAKPVSPVIAGNRITWPDLYPEIDLVIEALNDRVKFRRIIKSAAAPAIAEFTIQETGKSHLVYRAQDANGEPIAVDALKAGDRLTESLQLSGKTLPVAVDPTWQVGASADDLWVRWTGAAWERYALTSDERAGYGQATEYKYGSGMRWQNVTVPRGSVITAASIRFTAQVTIGNTVVNSRITGEAVDNAAAFSTLEDYQARRGTVVGGATDDNITAAQVDWDNIPAWSAEAEYDTPDITAIIQEIVNRPGWNNGNSLVLFWDDHENRSDNNDWTWRRAYSYDGDSAKAPVLNVEFTPPGAAALVALDLV